MRRPAFGRNVAGPLRACCAFLWTAESEFKTETMDLDSARGRSSFPLQSGSVPPQPGTLCVYLSRRTLYCDPYFDCFCMLLFPGDDREFSESFPVSAVPEDYGVPCASVVFCRVERPSDVGRCCRYFRIGCWFLAVRGLQPGQCKQIVFGLKNGRAPERETRRRTESQVIFTFGKAVFMSGDLGGTKQRSMAIAERALFVILNIRGNVRSSATLSRGPRAGDAESPVVCPSWNCPGNRASLESKAGPSRSASQWAAGLRAPPLFSLSFCCSRPAALESETGVACLCLADLGTWKDQRRTKRQCLKERACCCILCIQRARRSACQNLANTDTASSLVIQLPLQPRAEISVQSRTFAASPSRMDKHWVISKAPVLP